MATDKTQGLPHVAAATTAEIFGAALAKHVQKRLASLTRSRDACEAELKIVCSNPSVVVFKQLRNSIITEDSVGYIEVQQTYIFGFQYLSKFDECSSSITDIIHYQSWISKQRRF